MKRILCALLAALMLISFVACTSDNGDTKTTTTTTTTTTRRQDIGTEDPGLEDEGGEGEGYAVDVWLAYGTPIVDGVWDSGVWDKAQAIELTTVMKDNPLATVTAYQMWDNERLYFFFKVLDDDVAQDAEAGDWHNDGIYLYISELCSFDITSFDSYSNGTYQFAIINQDKTVLPRYGEQDFETTDFTCQVNIVEGGIDIEFSYTPKHLELKAGSQICLDYQYNDCTEGGTRIGCLSWFRATDGAASPLGMGIGQLLADGEAIPE